MAKTATITATRSLKDITEEFATISDSGALRYHQARLTYEYVGSTEGKEAAELKETFAKEANEALRRHNEAPLSVPGVTNLVNTWKYMLRANIDTNPESNPHVIPTAKAAFNLASQTFRKKEENYVIPAIEAIQNGADPAVTFQKQTDLLKKDKKADQDSKPGRPNAGVTIDENITFDAVTAVLALIPTLTFDENEKATLRDLLANASAAVAE